MQPQRRLPDRGLVREQEHVRLQLKKLQTNQTKVIDLIQTSWLVLASELT